MDDLISLIDDDPVSPTTNASIDRKMPSNERPQAGHRDSFSDLTGMMKAKKPYPPLSPTTNGKSSFSIQS